MARVLLTDLLNMLDEKRFGIKCMTVHITSTIDPIKDAVFLHAVA